MAVEGCRRAVELGAAAGRVGASGRAGGEVVMDERSGRVGDEVLLLLLAWTGERRGFSVPLGSVEPPAGPSCDGALAPRGLQWLAARVGWQWPRAV